MKKAFYLHLFLALVGLCIISTAAQAADGVHNWQLGFQDAVSPVKEHLANLHQLILYIITAIVIFVSLLLAYVCFRFSAKRNPVPSKTTHNTLLEIVWTTIPVIILIVIAIPTFRTLYYVDKTEEAEMTLKVIGHQWYWEYQYPDQGDITFDSYMLKDDELKPGQPRLLEVDNRVVLPVDTTVKVLITSADVIHDWAMPSMGIKTDAVPGRLNETWLRITKPGVYYGQCSELCGVGHGFMPIAIEAVSKEEFKAWVEKAKKQFSQNMLPAYTFAALPTE